MIRCEMKETHFAMWEQVCKLVLTVELIVLNTSVLAIPTIYSSLLILPHTILMGFFAFPATKSWPL